MAATPRSRPSLPSPSSLEAAALTGAGGASDADELMPVTVALRLKPNPDSLPVAMQPDPRANHVHFLDLGLEDDAHEPRPSSFGAGAAGGGRFDFLLAESASQRSVFQTVVQQFVPLLLDGYDLHVLCYGQTHAGKTYTLVGPELPCATNEKDLGLIPRVLRDVFQRLTDAPDEEPAAVRVSFVEEDNHGVRDLLGDADGDLDGANTAAPDVAMTQVECHTVNDAIACLETGLALQKDLLDDDEDDDDVVNYNALPGRQARGAHSLFTLHVRRRVNGRRFNSRLRFVELAGSDLLNGHNQPLNSGLFQLKQIVNALGSNNQDYNFSDRHSLLSIVLREALGGHALTILLCCVSTLARDRDASRDTLDFAAHASQVRNQPLPNDNPAVARRDSDASHLRSASVVHGNIPFLPSSAPPPALHVPPPAPPPSHIYHPESLLSPTMVPRAAPPPAQPSLINPHPYYALPPQPQPQPLPPIDPALIYNLQLQLQLHQQLQLNATYLQQLQPSLSQSPSYTNSLVGPPAPPPAEPLANSTLSQPTSTPLVSPLSQQQSSFPVQMYWQSLPGETAPLESTPLKSQPPPPVAAATAAVADDTANMPINLPSEEVERKSEKESAEKDDSRSGVASDKSGFPKQKLASIIEEPENSSATLSSLAASRQCMQDKESSDDDDAEVDDDEDEEEEDFDSECSDMSDLDPKLIELACKFKEETDSLVASFQEGISFDKKPNVIAEVVSLPEAVVDRLQEAKCVVEVSSRSVQTDPSGSISLSNEFRTNDTGDSGWKMREVRQSFESRLIENKDRLKEEEELVKNSGIDHKNADQVAQNGRTGTICDTSNKENEAVPLDYVLNNMSQTVQNLRDLEASLNEQRADLERQHQCGLPNRKCYGECDTQFGAAMARLDEVRTIVGWAMEYKQQLKLGTAVDYGSGADADTNDDDGRLLAALRGLSVEEARALVHRMYERVLDLLTEGRRQGARNERLDKQMEAVYAQYADSQRRHKLKVKKMQQDFQRQDRENRHKETRMYEMIENNQAEIDRLLQQNQTLKNYYRKHRNECGLAEGGGHGSSRKTAVGAGGGKRTVVVAAPSAAAQHHQQPPPQDSPGRDQKKPGKKKLVIRQSKQ